MAGAEGVRGVKVISLGAGVQSTALLLMSLNGDIEPADRAIFSDTMWEPKSVYNHLDRLMEYAKKMNFPIDIVSAGNIRKDALDMGKRFASMPLFTKDLKSGKVSILRRQCTREYKLQPIMARLKELGASKRNPVETWIGISTDEMQRMKDSRVQYSYHRWPLIEQRMDRNKCRRYLGAIGWGDTPKSSCIGCPFHDDHFWDRLKTESPEEFADAVEFDEAIRINPRLRDEAFLHRSGVPLKDVIFHSDTNQMDLFLEDCEGMCGI